MTSIMIPMLVQRLLKLNLHEIYSRVSTVDTSCNLCTLSKVREASFAGTVIRVLNS